MTISRSMDRTGWKLPAIGLGCWQLGADWGKVSEADALAILRSAYEAGVRLFDTADAYGDGRSEQLIGRFLRTLGSHGAEVVVATKVGRRAQPHVAEAYTPDALHQWVQRSLTNLGVEVLDLVQLHCPPTAVYGQDEVFDALDGLVAEGLMRAYGVSVETCDEALRAIERPNVASVQIVFNAFRQKPAEQVLPAAARAGVAILARVPLASGLLSGRYTTDTTFPPDDHRTYNRHGEAFDVGETFSGVPFEVGVDAAQEFAALAPEGATPAQLALRWIVAHEEVTAAIPGARTPQQARASAAVLGFDPLDRAVVQAVDELYDRRLREHVHHRW